MIRFSLRHGQLVVTRLQRGRSEGIDFGVQAGIAGEREQVGAGGEQLQGAQELQLLRADRIGQAQGAQAEIRRVFEETAAGPAGRVIAEAGGAAGRNRKGPSRFRLSPCFYWSE